MGYWCILIPRPKDEEVCRGRKKLKEIPRRLHCWVDVIPWVECKLPNKVHDAEDHLKSITAKMNLCVLASVKADATTTKEQGDRGVACEEQVDNDREEKERKDDKEEDQEDEDMDEERKDDEDEEEKEKKEEERKDGDNDEERNHDADNEYNDMNEENQTKHLASQVSCHHEVEINKKLEAISLKLDFVKDVNFDEWDYEAVRILSSIIDGVQNRDELIQKQKSKDFDSPLNTTPAKRAK
ncbi:Ubiquitinyl hydrolase 1 [Handroanthus impetiginosus]|uniref:Ubiquitinyl hydrolase 1 n=1 Tax=Handroanthus impetiginosus TaxID=429701 RepID=A0A2G9I6J2_9LAMI|nr:Ubiquitinyl hydrolase 1 [Handroanthus impetiginosus]